MTRKTPPQDADPYLRIAHDVLHSEAYRYLNPPAQSMLIEFLLAWSAAPDYADDEYVGAPIRFTYTTSRMNISKNCWNKYRNELVDFGFIINSSQGRYRRSQEWRQVPLHHGDALKRGPNSAPVSTKEAQKSHLSLRASNNYDQRGNIKALLLTARQAAHIVIGAKIYPAQPKNRQKIIVVENNNRALSGAPIYSAYAGDPHRADYGGGIVEYAELDDDDNDIF